MWVTGHCATSRRVLFGRDSRKMALSDRLPSNHPVYDPPCMMHTGQCEIRAPPSCYVVDQEESLSTAIAPQHFLVRIKRTQSTSSTGGEFLYTRSICIKLIPRMGSITPGEFNSDSPDDETKRHLQVRFNNTPGTTSNTGSTWYRCTRSTLE